MPPHIQGAERRTGLGTKHTDHRWGPRQLVVGGPAGAAWLLTGGAAHPADRTDGRVGSPVGSVVDGDATVPVTGLLAAAAQPPETGHLADQHQLAGPIRLTGGPASAQQQLTDRWRTAVTLPPATGRHRPRCPRSGPIPQPFAPKRRIVSA